MPFPRRGLRAAALASLLVARAQGAGCSQALAMECASSTADDGGDTAFSALQLRSAMLSWGSAQSHGQALPRSPLSDSRLARSAPAADDRDEDTVTLMRVGAASSKAAAPQSGASSPPCPLLSGVLPTGAALAAMLVALGLLRLHVRRTNEAQAARSIYLMLNFILVMNYTVVILDSYDLCKAVGLSGAASGRMVGTYMLGFCAGAVCMWLLVRFRPSLWRDAPQKVLLAGLSFQLLGAAAYTFVAQEVVGSRHGPGASSFSPFLQDLLPRLLMLSRFVGGIGSGSCQQFYVSGMLHITPVSARTVHTARWVFSGMLAIGLGPVIAALEQEIEPCKGGGTHFELAGHVQVIVALGSMTAVAWLHPDLADCSDCMNSDSEDENEPASPASPASSSTLLGERWKRRLVVCGCLCMASMRAFGVSAIEVVIAMILEEQYDWDQRVTGLTIGAVFLCCIPLKILHSLVSDSLGVVSWIRLLAGFAFMGSWLLYASAGKFLPISAMHIGGAQQLIIAGVIVFPTFYLSDALSSGLMHQHVLSNGSLLDGNHAQLWYNLMQGLGRFLGPWLARASVQAHGQDSFAAQQMAVTLAFLCIFEGLVRPFLKAVPDDKLAPLRQISM